VRLFGNLIIEYSRHQAHALCGFGIELFTDERQLARLPAAA